MQCKRPTRSVPEERGVKVTVSTLSTKKTTQAALIKSEGAEAQKNTPRLVKREKREDSGGFRQVPERNADEIPEAPMKVKKELNSEGLN